MKEKEAKKTEFTSKVESFVREIQPLLEGSKTKGLIVISCDMSEEEVQSVQGVLGWGEAVIEGYAEFQISPQLQPLRMAALSLAKKKATARLFEQLIPKPGQSPFQAYGSDRDRRSDCLTMEELLSTIFKR